MSVNLPSNKLLQIFEAIDFYRSLILDLCEQQLGGQKEWPYFRSRLLDVLGNKGLQGRLRTILSEVSL